MSRQWKFMSVLVCVLALLMQGIAQGAMDREKLLTDPGVYGSFAVFKVTGEWWRLDKEVRVQAVAEIKAVFQKHAESVVTDIFLVRGLSEKADFFVRLHSTEMMNNQNFLIDLMSTALGKHLMNTDTFNGITKKANYVPTFPDDLKTAMKTTTEPGPKPYAIVIPIRKDAEWWTMAQDGRDQMMKEHADATVAYLKTVKRKLYHSSGLDDLDFITYFETAKLDDFHNLVLGLERVKENRHNRQFGSPTLLGTIRPLDEILEVLTR